MRANIYIDHIKPVEGGIEDGSIVRSRDNHLIIGRFVAWIGNRAHISLLRNSIGITKFWGSYILNEGDIELIKCKITIK